MRDQITEALAVLTIIASIIFSVGTVAFLIAAVVNRIEFPGKAACIEQLRADVQKTSVLESEDVLGQVTEANQLIVAMQRYNEIWWAGAAIPDGWDDIELIAIPDRGANQK